MFQTLPIHPSVIPWVAPWPFSPMQAKDVCTSFLNDNVVKNGGSTQYTFSMNGPFEKVEKCSRSVEHIFGNKCPCSFWMYSIAAWLLPWWLSYHKLFHARLRLLPHQGEGKSWSKKTRWVYYCLFPAILLKSVSNLKHIQINSCHEFQGLHFTLRTWSIGYF